MISLNNLTIRSKFSIPLIFISSLVIAISLFSLRNEKNLTAELQEFSTAFMEASTACLNADRDLYQALTALQNFLLTDRNDNAMLKIEREQFEENAEQALDRMNRAKALMAGYPEIAQLTTQFDRDYKTWLTASESIFNSVYSRPDKADASALITQNYLEQFQLLREHYDQVGETIHRLSNEKLDMANMSHAQQIKIVSSIILFSVIGCIATIVIGPKLITTRINQLDNMIASISAGGGDLRTRLDSSGKDEVSQLARTFNLLMDKLQGLVQMIKTDANVLNNTLVTLNHSADQSQSISQQQSLSMEQIATAVNELNYAVREVANHSHQASDHTHQAKDFAGKADQAVQGSLAEIKTLAKAVEETNQVIGKLAEESKSIAKVLDVIREIADQTNLLALNAAIEAARAGEQGRGFAVVADEVRTLASRTQESTEDIQRMIIGLENGVTHAVTTMTNGTSRMDIVVKEVSNIKTSLDMLNESAVQTFDMIHQIATATEEQSYTVDEINKNINSLNSLSQDILSVVTKTKSASDNIEQAASSLRGNVQLFTV